MLSGSQNSHCATQSDFMAYVTKMHECSLKKLDVTDFDTIAHSYVKVSEYNAYNHLYERPAMHSVLPADVRGLRVLDAGCAGGAHTEWLVERGAIVTALDISPAMVRLADSRLAGRAQVIRADLRQPLHLPSSSFDIVFSSLTMHYIKHWGPVLAEFHRILCNSGLLVLSTNHPGASFCLSDGSDYYSVKLVEQLWPDFGPDVVGRFYTRSLDMIYTSIRDAGFGIDLLCEPKPLPEMSESHPQTFDSLSRSPWFLVLRLAKLTQNLHSPHQNMSRLARQ